eukprot:TRINITY_DN111445_c0_g1_i1.p1 TRINITY_DN111445_c0_g1~~TRINITY_DN111445_c0_g1_i1.p1  ORF type:complete len:466 (-),score=102.51 TRINITY_DN111445_c0_g1_i1:71-1468(-)
MQLPYRLRLANEARNGALVKGDSEAGLASSDGQEKEVDAPISIPPPVEEKKRASVDGGYGAVRGPVERPWQRRGEPFELFMEAAVASGRQLVALGFIISQVLTTHAVHDGNLMACDPIRYGKSKALMCEYTKSYVRCFPLLALAVSLMVATRMVLNQRVYYQLLKHDCLISFEPLVPIKDGLFRILVFCFVNSVPHFILNIWVAHKEVFNSLEMIKLQNLDSLQASAKKLMADNVLHDTHQVAVFYFVPAIVFLLFLYASYDTEDFLLPLSKYFEDDFEASRLALKRVRFLREPEAASRVQRGLSFEGAHGTPCTAADVFKELMDSAATDAPAVVARHNKKQHRGLFMGHREESLTRWRVTWTMWPARLLLDRRLSDKESVSFRRAWHVFMGVSLMVMVFVFTCLTKQLTKDIYDVLTGQAADMASCIVETGHLILTLWLFAVILMQTATPSNAAPIMSKLLWKQ